MTPSGSNIGRKTTTIMSCRRYETHTHARWRTYSTLKLVTTIFLPIFCTYGAFFVISPSQSPDFITQHDTVDARVSLPSSPLARIDIVLESRWAKKDDMDTRVRQRNSAETKKASHSGCLFYVFLLQQLQILCNLW